MGPGRPAACSVRVWLWAGPAAHRASDLAGAAWPARSWAAAWRHSERSPRRAPTRASPRSGWSRQSSLLRLRIVGRVLLGFRLRIELLKQSLSLSRHALLQPGHRVQLGIVPVSVRRVARAVRRLLLEEPQELQFGNRGQQRLLTTAPSSAAAPILVLLAELIF